MCLLCADRAGDRALAHRIHVLQLLALVEHPDALPADAALRLGQEIMTLIRQKQDPLRCEPVMPPEPDIRETR